MEQLKSESHSKHLLLYHLIFSTKYRHKLFQNINGLSNKIKELSFEICNKHKIQIHYVETDKDHIHYMIETIPNCNLANIIKTLKSYTSFHIWEYFENELKQYYWKYKTFWSTGYFISSIGNVSQETLKHYIENQGKIVKEI